MAETGTSNFFSISPAFQSIFAVRSSSWSSVVVASWLFKRFISYQRPVINDRSQLTSDLLKGSYL